MTSRNQREGRYLGHLRLLTGWTKAVRAHRRHLVGPSQARAELRDRDLDHILPVLHAHHFTPFRWRRGRTRWNWPLARALAATFVRPTVHRVTLK